MWYKYLVIIILFYFFALLQSSFFAHFTFFGSFPNLVFIFLFLLIFFGGKKMGADSIIYTVIAGLILDVFSASIFGVSVILLIALGFVVKKIQSSLNEKEDKYPFLYFLPLFLVCFLAYELLLALYLHSLVLNWTFAAGLVYNSACAGIGYFILKRLNVQKISGKKFRI